MTELQLLRHYDQREANTSCSRQKKGIIFIMLVRARGPQYSGTCSRSAIRQWRWYWCTLSGQLSPWCLCTCAFWKNTPSAFTCCRELLKRSKKVSGTLGLEMYWWFADLKENLYPDECWAFSWMPFCPVLRFQWASDGVICRRAKIGRIRPPVALLQLACNWSLMHSRKNTNQETLVQCWLSFSDALDNY